jgi:chloramphenicol O-acetyltransferase type A
MQIIDLNNWDRTTHYQFFLRADLGQYNICTNLDLTYFKAKCKQLGLPLYYAMVYAVTFTLNQVEAFRYRIRENQVVLHDKVHPYFSDMTEESDLFKMVMVEFESDIVSFAGKAKEKADGQTEYFIAQDIAGRDDVIFLSCVPWVSFSSISHTMSFCSNDCIPRLSWGKYFEENGKLMLPFSVQAHHSFVDGIHMGQYIDKLQEFLNLN